MLCFIVYLSAISYLIQEKTSKLMNQLKHKVIRHTYNLFNIFIVYSKDELYSNIIQVWKFQNYT